MHAVLPARSFICFGHRGAAGHAPENTLKAVERGMALGARWIEVDVRCAGGVPVVIHDATLRRTTNGTGRVSRRSLRYLRSLDAGEGERVPLLDEVLDLIGDRAGLNIELKERGTAAPVVAAVRERVRARRCSYRRLLISAFDHRLLREVRGLDSRIPLAPLFRRGARDMVGRALRLHACALTVPVEVIDGRLIARAHGSGLRVFVYTVNDARRIATLRAMGVDGVFSDFPDRVRAPRVGAPAG